ncbi:hypothetical protein QBC47DRAFT_379193 [Echria macrotheca]|uniref:Zn(2)-C6 fungal-type domain-containing protein n=1 Tax=Echria macrotheca TaxID=438768 RepID=A0AAJ0F6W7_9PEZI|nr:hypothetical protein QBC47DRAFT_379193 [Echria macrotheca]
MASSVASAGASPLSSGYDYAAQNTDGTGDDDTNNNNAWAFVSMPNSASPSSVGFYPSPASATLGSSWGIIGHTAGPHSDPPSSLAAGSPLNLPLDSDQPGLFSDGSFTDQTGAFAATSAGDAQFYTGTLFPSDNDFLAAAAASNSLLTAQFSAELNLNNLLSQQFPSLTTADQQALQGFDYIHIPEGLLPSADAPPWNPTELREAAAVSTGSSPMFVMEDPSFVSPSPPPPQRVSPGASSQASSISPRSPPMQIKQEDGSRTSPKPIAIRKVRDARVGKKTSAKKSPSSVSPLSSSGGSSSGNSLGASMFLIVTPDSVNAHADKSNPFDCHDALRSSQRGRKGPLANETKESALKVRRLGACFHCHARKVRCEETRPCKNCDKLRQTVPHAMCWQFDDFDVVLFPDFIRGHFARDEMSRFIGDNILAFSVDGVEKPCTVELMSGGGFGATLSIRAKFFTAKTAEVLQQWHLERHSNGVADLHPRSAAPIGLDPDSPLSKDDIRKKADKYIQAMVSAPAFAELVTNDCRHTRLPRTILRIVQDYATRADNAMVKRALSIYAMHYVMTHQLCLTPQNIAALAPTRLVPQDSPFVTPRVLNRQIKAVIDDMLRAEISRLFKSFGSTLKPKERKGWAPCLAAFLVLCLFMESVETAADTFVISENQIALQEGQTPRWRRQFALAKNAEIENMPFKQVAFQFHQLYQTHSRDAGSRSFNPLTDDACLDGGELDRDAMAMVMQLRRLLQDPNCKSTLSLCVWI